MLQPPADQSPPECPLAGAVPDPRPITNLTHGQLWRSQLSPAFTLQTSVSRPYLLPYQLLLSSVAPQPYIYVIFLPKMHFFVTREITGVFVWSLIACTFRICLSSLVALSMLRSNEESNDYRQRNCSLSPEGDGSCLASQISGLPEGSVILKEVITVLSVIASWALAILPSKVATLSAPGFTFGSTWILFPLRDYFGFIPNLPCRICETKMGRLR